MFILFLFLCQRPSINLSPVAWGRRENSYALPTYHTHFNYFAGTRLQQLRAWTTADNRNASRRQHQSSRARYRECDLSDAEAPLANIGADGTALADALRRRGYDVEFVADATKEQLSRAVSRLEAKVRPGSTFVLSFGGYAIQSEGQNYLLPVDAKIWTERDVRMYGLSVGRLLSEFERAGAQERIALLDASRRNPFERRFRSYSHGLASMPSNQDEVIASAVPPDEVADEQPDSHGSLAKAVAGELQVPLTPVDDTYARLSAATRAILTQPVISPAS
jgi:hypothetical protein